MRAPYASRTTAEPSLAGPGRNAAAPADALPSVSAILLCYDCAAYAEQALRSALAQDYAGPLEIVVSDDASVDGTFTTIQKVIGEYRGPHRVKVNRRAVNSGSKSAHLNDVFPLCSGDILVSFDGDDVSRDSRVRMLVEAFDDDPAVQAVFSSYWLMDAAGRPTGRGHVPRPPDGADARGWFARIDAYASGATLAVRRSVIESFGPLDPAINEDVVLPFRASLLGAVRFIDEPLVKVRRHPGSLTADFDGFASIERYRARLEWGIDKARQALGSRLEDIRVAAELKPHEQGELHALERLVHDSMAAAEMTRPLTSASFLDRVAALLRLMRAGADPHALPQHVCLALMPGLYLRYKRRKLGAARAPSVEPT